MPWAGAILLAAASVETTNQEMDMHAHTGLVVGTGIRAGWENHSATVVRQGITQNHSATVIRRALTTNHAATVLSGWDNHSATVVRAGR